MPFDSVSGSIAGSRSKRGKSIISQESFRDGLKHIAQDIIDSVDISSLTNSQKIQYLKVVLPYIIDKNKKVDDSEKHFRVEIIE